MNRAVAVVVLLVAACGNAQTPTEPLTPEFHAQPVDWYLISIDTATVRVGYHMSGIASDCERAGPTSADVTSDAVTITARKLITTQAKACTEELQLYEEDVTLDAPLGDRELRGCMPTADLVDEDATCRDLERSRQAGYLSP